MILSFLLPNTVIFAARIYLYRQKARLKRETRKTTIPTLNPPACRTWLKKLTRLRERFVTQESLSDEALNFLMNTLPHLAFLACEKSAHACVCVCMEFCTPRHALTRTRRWGGRMK